MKILYPIFLIFLFITACKSDNTKETYTEKLVDYVNPFVGTDGPGNTYPGAVVPFGMVQLSPDNGLPGWDRIAGYYWQDSTIAGFSHTHLSGTGAGDMYDILVYPYNNKFTKDLWPGQTDYRPYSMFSHSDETAEPGYYKVLLKSTGIVTELTTTKRVGFHRYTFPEGHDSKILIDLGYKLNWDNPLKTRIVIEDSVTISGMRWSEGWAKDQRLHFVAQFSVPFDSVSLYEGVNAIKADRVNSNKSSAVFHFNNPDKQKVLLKVALSTASVDGARKNLQAELSGWDFEQVKRQASLTWEKYLSKIIVKGNQYQKEVFYSNLYHTALTPSLHSDIDGKYKAANGEIREAKNYDRYHTFSLWDTYRAAHPLYTILEPELTIDFINSFLGHYDETGLLPVWELAGNETNMMIGYHAIPVIYDAYLKGLEFDYVHAYEACKASAMDKNRSINEYIKLGYVPSDGEEHGHWSVSKTLEYSYGDWCVAQLAKNLGYTKDYEYFSKRADNWKNHWDESSTFLRPKDSEGNFVSPFIPKEYTELFCESNAWHYFWHVQHDIDGLVNLIGKDRFSAKLDSMFSYYPVPEDDLPIFSTGMIGQYAHGNEPSHHVPFLYNYINRPEETQILVRKIIESQYTNKPDGYCGNEDCGQMSAWLVFSSLGFYPVNPASGIYDICAPWFDKATIELPGSKILRIICKGGKPEKRIISEVRLNGKTIQNFQLSHKDLCKGGVLEFKFKQ